MLRPTMFLRGASRPLMAARSTAIRAYSVQAPQLAGVDPSKLVIQRTSTPSELMKEEDLVFGRTFTGTCCTPETQQHHHMCRGQWMLYAILTMLCRPHALG